MSEYDYTTTIETRYRDLDHMEHVNNAVYVTYLESARIDFFRDRIGEPIPDAVVAHLELDFESSITLDQTVEVALGVTEIGDTSVTVGYEILADGEVAARAETTLVVLDEDRSPRSVPERWRDRLAIDGTAD